MNSNIIKAVVLTYYRFKRGYHVSTETWVARGIADVLTISKDLKTSVEIEVKMSISDLKNEFTKKALKHKELLKETNTWNKTNYFYICIPESLLEKSKQILLANGCNKYGIMIISETYDLKIVKNAKRLNHCKNDNLYSNLVLRATSELVNTYIDRYTPKKSIKKEIRDGAKKADVRKL